MVKYSRIRGDSNVGRVEATLSELGFHVSPTIELCVRYGTCPKRCDGYGKIDHLHFRRKNKIRGNGEICEDYVSPE